jgi:squalene synthase HpnD
MSGEQNAVNGLVRQSRTSFYWAMRLLSRERQEAMFAIYAYCRTLDDIADCDAPAKEKLANLAEWRKEAARLIAGDPSHPIARALTGPVTRFKLNCGEFLAIIDGMEMDVLDQMQAPDWDLLRLYCRRVAGSVGALAVPVFHRHSAEGEALAIALGEALQLTNILRDLKEDSQLGRLYLPREALDHAGIPPGPIAAILADPRLPAACAWLTDRAEESYAEAGRLFAILPSAPMRPARTMMVIYRRLLTRLCKRGWANLEPPPREPRLALLWIAARQFLPA